MLVYSGAPSQWRVYRFSELCRYQRPIFTLNPQASYKELTVRLFGKGLEIRREVNASELLADEMQLLKEGDIVTSIHQFRNGAVGIIDRNLNGSILSKNFLVYEVNIELAIPKYLLLVLTSQQVISRLQANSTGSATPIFPKKNIEALEIPLPPLSEQHRIVKIIDSIAKKIQTAKNLRKETTQETEFLLKNFSDRILSRNEYEHIPLPDATFRITKGESPAWQGFSYQESGPVFIRSENVLWGKIDITSCAHIPLEFHAKLARSQLKPNDVLINLVGASIGRACKVPEDMGPANVNQAVAVITPDPDKLESNYLLDLLLSQTTQTTLHGGKVETARPNISLDDIKKLRLPIPPIHEQGRIVAYLDDLQAKINKLKELQHQTAAELDALLPSILDKAFKAQL